MKYLRSHTSTNQSYAVGYERSTSISKVRGESTLEHVLWVKTSVAFTNRYKYLLGMSWWSKGLFVERFMLSLVGSNSWHYVFEFIADLLVVDKHILWI